jgi:hypothetical protein
MLDISRELYKALDGDYGKINGDGLYEEDIRKYALSDAVIDELIIWHSKVKTLLLEEERDKKINNILEDDK